MANYYWVGGSGTWDETTTTNWASSSGGAGGAGVPTFSDNAYFDGSSDTGAGFTVTIGANAICKDFIVGNGTTVTTLDQTMTLAGSGSLSIYGSLYYPATNLTNTYTGSVTFSSTTTGNTITTNGVSLTGATLFNTGCVFNSVTGGWVLGSDLTVSVGTIELVAGNLDTNSFNVTCGRFRITSSDTKTLSLRSSTLTLNQNNTQAGWFYIGSNLTFNAGTSTIDMSRENGAFAGGGLTFYNLSFTNFNIATVTLSGTNTFNNITFESRSATGVSTISISENQIINGTLSIQSTNTNLIRRVRIISNTVGTARTITAAAVSLGTGLDFRDITAAGASAPWDVSTKAAGNCLGNSQITFPAAKTVYRRGAGNWSATQWSDSSGGTAAAQWFPLAQDTMVFDANTTTGTHTIDAAWQLGTLNMTNSTTVTLASGTAAPAFYGGVTLSNAVTLSGTGIFTFSGRNTQTITSSGKTFTQPLTVNSPGGTVIIADNLTSNLAFNLTQGTIDVNDLILTAASFSSSNSNTRSIDFGTGKIIVKGTGTVWTTANNAGFTVAGTPVVDVDNNTATATTVTTGALSEANAISFNYISGTYTLTSTAGNAYKNLNFTGFAGTVSNLANTIYGNLIIDDAATYSAGNEAWTFAATSGNQQITTDGETLDFALIINSPGATVQFQDALTMGLTRTLTLTNGTLQFKSGTTNTIGNFATSGTNQKYLSATTPGSQATISKLSGTVDVSYLTIQDSNAAGGATWNAYVNQSNIDNGNNDGWDFSISPVIGAYEYTYQLRSFTQPRRF